jgi:hypothetical protein
MTTQEYRIQKLKEFAEREEQKQNEEAKQMAELKVIWEKQQARRK